MSQLARLALSRIAGTAFMQLGVAAMAQGSVCCEFQALRR